MTVMIASSIRTGKVAIELIFEIYRKLEVTLGVACREAKTFGWEFQHDQAV